MTKFQALYVLWLRHEKCQSYSWRMLVRKYYERYGIRGAKHSNIISSQLEGMVLEYNAWKILRPNPSYGEPLNLFEIDLSLLDANLKRHIK